MGGVFDHVAYLISYNKEYYNTDRYEEIGFDFIWTNLDRVYQNLLQKNK